MCRDGATGGPAGGHPDELAAGGLTGAVDVLEVAAEAFSVLDRGCLDGGEMREQLCRAHKLFQRLQAGVAKVADWYLADGTWRESRLSSPAAELSHLTGAKQDDFGAWFLLGKGLRKRPKVDDALREGEIDLQRAEKLCCLARNRRYKKRYPDSEEMLLGFARTQDWDTFNKAIVEWKKRADPDGTVRDAADDHEARYVKLTSGLRGLGILDGELTATCAELVRNGLQRVASELWQTDWTEAQERLGRDPEPGELARSHEQRLHDALQEAFVRAFAAPADGKRPQPLLTVFVGEDSLTKICELDSGTVITETQILPLLDDAVIERIVWDGPSRVLDISEKRTFRGALRRAIQARDRHCQFPGCKVPAKWCEVDHRQPWSKNGKTIQANGQLLCKRHNVSKGDSLPGQPPRRRLTGPGADTRTLVR